MKFNFKNKKGFTLIELLIAMSIFLIFTGALIGSYSGIVRSQREANEYRILYVEARKVFEVIIQELRDGMVDYEYYAKTGTFDKNSICLISKDARTRTFIENTEGIVKVSKKNFAPGTLPVFDGSECVNSADSEIDLNSEVKLPKISFYISPGLDPFNQKNVYEDLAQFQPKVTLYAQFEKEFNNGRKYLMDLQTTVSSRIYNQVYKNTNF
ncbi:MAG: type II secretion system protein [Patescibacteria group bacterium]